MLMLPPTPPLIYLKLIKIKGPKMDHFTFSLFSLHKDGVRRSIAGTARHSIKPLLKQISRDRRILRFGESKIRIYAKIRWISDENLKSKKLNLGSRMRI